MRDYKKIGFKCGLEIHQQLQTKEKLFCSCKSELAPKDETFLEINRKLRPVAGETGDVDIAALHETLGEKEFIYRMYPEQSCAVEIDSEPIHRLNPNALKTVLLIAKMLHCDIPDELQVMRKLILNGSVVSSFQRTILVGLNGYLETEFGRVGIENVYLEEDAAQMIKKEKNKVIYGLDRLGIPLVEIGTTPNIPNPEQAKAVAEKLGMMLRSTRKIKTGLGTIRQDLNVSIDGGNRVEIKGVQRLNDIPKLLENEVERQQQLVASKKKVSKDVRKALPDGKTKFLRPLPGASRLYPETDAIPIQISREMLSKIKIPKLITERTDSLRKKYKLQDDIAKQLIREDKDELFVELINLGFEQKTVLSTLTSYAKETGASNNHVRNVFRLFKKNRIKPAKEMIKELLKSKSPEKLIGKTESITEKHIENIVDRIIKKNPSVMKAGKPANALMGLVMKETRGKAPGSVVMKIALKKLKRTK